VGLFACAIGAGLRERPADLNLLGGLGELKRVESKSLERNVALIQREPLYLFYWDSFFAHCRQWRGGIVRRTWTPREAIFGAYAARIL